MDASQSESEQERAARRLDAIYSELRALVQPAATFNDAPFARREELEREAADLRHRWDLVDPRSLSVAPPGPITRFLRRQWAFYAGPQFPLAVMQTVLWPLLGITWLVAAVREPEAWRIAIAVASLALGAVWVVLLTGAVACRRRQQHAVSGKGVASRSDDA